MGDSARLPSAEEEMKVMQTLPDTVRMVNDSKEQLTPDNARLRSAKEVVIAMQTSPGTVLVANDFDGLVSADNVCSCLAEEEMTVDYMADGCDQSKSNQSFNILPQSSHSKEKSKGKDRHSGKDNGKGTEKGGG